MSIGSIQSTTSAIPTQLASRPSVISGNGQTYNDEQVKQFVQANQGNTQALAQQAKEMGLNVDQIHEALAIGGLDVGIDVIRSYAQQNGYAIDAKDQKLAEPDQNSASIDKWTNAWSPTQNRWITPSEVKAFLDTNPSDKKIFEKASALGLSTQDLNTALRGQGYTGQALGQHYNRLTSNLYTGALGYSTDSNGTFDGKIVVGGGHTSVDSGRGDGSTVWLAGQASSIAFSSNGIEGAGYNGTNNWTVKDGYIGNLLSTKA